MILRAVPIASVACLLLCVGSTSGSTATKRKGTSPPSHVGDVARNLPAAPGMVPNRPGSGMPVLPGSGSKEPINIHADKLDFLNKDDKLIYTGNVLAVQGDSTLKASKLTIDLERSAPGGSAPATADATPAARNSSVRHMEADGPVTLTSKDQVGTGDHASYDKAENKVHLVGSVTLSQGPTSPRVTAWSTTCSPDRHRSSATSAACSRRAAVPRPTPKGGQGGKASAA